jgi:hypothetical protein
MLEQKLKTLFEKYGPIIINRMIEKMNDLDLNASGAAARSLKYVVEPDGLSILGKDYFAQINKGRMPGEKPPMQNLLGWVQNRMAVEDEKEQRRVAYAVQRTIGKKGTIERFNYGGSDLLDFIVKTEIRGKFQGEALIIVKNDLMRQAKELKNEIKKQQ